MLDARVHAAIAGPGPASSGFYSIRHHARSGPFRFSSLERRAPLRSAWSARTIMNSACFATRGVLSNPRSDFAQRGGLLRAARLIDGARRSDRAEHGRDCSGEEKKTNDPP